MLRGGRAPSPFPWDEKSPILERRGEARAGDWAGLSQGLAHSYAILAHVLRFKGRLARTL